MIDVNNFKDYSYSEYEDNLKRLGISKHSDLVNKSVFYIKPEYGKHKVISWNADKGEYLLDIDGQRFYSSPFHILI